MNLLLRAFAGAAWIALLGGCDDRQAFRRPDPTLARMLQQRRADPYAASSVFADGKTMREPIEDTVARGDVDPAAPPPPLTRGLVERGRVHFDVVCATCHGIAGDGVSVVASKMRGRPPPSLHEARIRALPASAVFDVITHGYGWMPSYDAMLEPEDRWAVVAYLRALQLSRNAAVGDLPQAVRDELVREAP